MNYSKFSKEQLVNLLRYSENEFLEMIELAEDGKSKSETRYEKEYEAGRIRAYRHALKIVRGND